MTYISGFVTPVPNDRRDAFIASARAAWAIFSDYGALEVTEVWGTDVPAGKQTDFARAVALKDGESVVFSWIRWPDKETSDACTAAMDTDPRFADLDMPFDGSRTIVGGFTPAFEQRR